MENIYLLMIIALAVLAIADLVVGVSNDAVNFLNSAIGSRAISFKTIMIVASFGIAIGALFSSGMMEVARNGIFNPSEFMFHEIMIIFMAVMITDILLLDFFNTLGLPTSTTVSIVFELLGASVAIALIKIGHDGGSFSDLVNYINTSKATEIVSSILLSVVLSFSLGALVQWVSRVLLSFNFEKKAKWVGALFGGIAITSIVYFIFMKGIGGTNFAKESIIQHINGKVGYERTINIDITRAGDLLGARGFARHRARGVRGACVLVAALARSCKGSTVFVDDIQTDESAWPIVIFTRCFSPLRDR